MSVRFITPSEVENITTQIFTETGTDPQVQAPIDITVLVKKFGIEVMEAEYEKDQDISGMAYKNKDGKYVIEVNKDESEPRKRFTIAHEFAHLVLHRDELRNNDKAFVDYRRSTFYYTGDEQKKETQANMLAASLLMPEAPFRSIYNANHKDIDDTASYFFVSKQAALVRLDSLGILDD
jgi:Zn-dependent peptidase ImmA (M78 family)